MHVRTYIICCVSFLFFSSIAAPAVAEPAAWYRQALQAEAEGDYAEALTLYERILREAPSSSAARTAMARQTDLEQYADHDFVPYGLFTRLRQEYLVLGSDQAIAKARAILQEYPDAAVAPEIRLWLGNEYREGRRDPAAAIEEYARLIEEHPEHPLARIAYDRMGRVYEAQGDFTRARAAYTALQQQFPEATTPERYRLRQQSLLRQAGRHYAYIGAVGTLVLALSLLPFLGIFRIRLAAWLRWSLPKAGLSLVIGVVPAAILSVVGEMWSPSLTVMGLSFAGYAFVLGALQARPVPPPPWRARVERVLYTGLGPLAILYVIVHRFALWEAFWI